ncbi:hypothetical protein KC952_01285 [Candidatus Saccharibacteria bacterium]|jgi:hypothetical protein|nr:hypothetical protein [Candidatus Saccharibacteria bacterium]
MSKKIRVYRIFLWAILIASSVLPVKYAMHYFGLEFIEQTSLHNSVVSSGIFVLGFVLSATIADYKESERIPAEFASNIEDMYNDAKQTHKAYPKFDLDNFRKSLIDVLGTFREGTRINRKGARREIADLQACFADMEQAGVPPNFVVKLKTQQTQLMKNLFRVNYIQKIQFIPSAFFLIKTIVIFIIGLLICTNIEPFYGGLFIVSAITFIMTYMLILIHHISTPFHAAGKTKDDVSLFLLKEAKAYLVSEGKVANQQP